jgi:hypothetical protein
MRCIECSSKSRGSVKFCGFGDRKTAAFLFGPLRPTARFGVKKNSGRMSTSWNPTFLVSLDASQCISSNAARSDRVYPGFLVVSLEKRVFLKMCQKHTKIDLDEHTRKSRRHPRLHWMRLDAAHRTQCKMSGWHDVYWSLGAKNRVVHGLVPKPKNRPVGASSCRTLDIFTDSDAA